MPAPPDLAAVLAEERACLAAGRIADLAALVPRKKAALDALVARGGEARAILKPLLAEARTNERLLAAALSGVRAALGRVRSIQSAASGLTSYTSEGRTIRHETRAGTVERRA